MEATTLRAWHGSAALKDEVLTRMIAHRQEDEIIQGNYQQVDPGLASGYKGCLIGCTLPAQPNGREPRVGWHEHVEAAYGIPTAVGQMLDDVFERLPWGRHADFAVDSIQAIPVGARLDMVVPALLLDVLADEECGMLRLAATDSQRDAIQAVVDLLRRRLAGDAIVADEWLDAARTASAAAAGAVGPARAAGVAAAQSASEGVDHECGGVALVYAVDTECTVEGRERRRCWHAARLLHHLGAAPVPA